ncbi:CLUMA_CG019796, isoform A [Clunio marinus]|uniref:CLUMA_CG019796, isoform A n=1 Tax=Clunio marinus TaxID=568069 RepID=A0A1J1J707_9DIPT|nr:CLUMA_CG019796, isoform A [Clunio marinus]
MYFLQSIDSNCGPSMCYIPSTCNRVKGMKDVNVWQIPFKNQFYNLLLTLHDKMMCQDCIVFCYWFCMALAIYGLTEALNEFFWTYRDKKYEPKRFLNRVYRKIPIKYRRNSRLCGGLLHIITSTFFLLGLLGLQNEMMLPWVILVGSIIVFEGLFLTLCMAAGEPNTHKPMLSLIFLLFRFAISLHMIMMIRSTQLY